MIRSMTGYGRFEGTIDGRNVVFEIKSVNHRFMELQCRTPRGCGFVEETVKSVVSRYVTRGKADVFTVRKAPENEEQLCAIVEKAGEQALAQFVAMREREGEKLRDDILGRCDAIISIVGEIEQRSPEIVEEYRTRLFARLSEILGDTTIEPQRILTEAAIFADKTAVDEETVRLRSHIDQLRGMLCASEPVGRKLDFIVQEMNREANTIGSKVSDAGLAHKVVAIKSEIEKIREQIQNIE